MTKRTRSLVLIGIALLTLAGCSSKSNSNDQSAAQGEFGPPLTPDSVDQTPLHCMVEGGCPEAVGELVAFAPHSIACTATLVSEDVILTAGHCVPWQNVDRSKRIRGQCWVRWPSSSGANEEKVECDSVVRASRPSNGQQVDNDYAYIRLAHAVDREPFQVRGNSRRGKGRETEVFGIQMRRNQHRLVNVRCGLDNQFELPGRKATPGNTIILRQCPIEQGYSGGPIIDMTGRLFGVISFMKVQSSANEERIAVGTRPPPLFSNF